MIRKKLLKCLTALGTAATIIIGTLPAMASLTAVTTDTDVPGWTFTSNYSDSNVYIDTSNGVRGSASMKIVNRTTRNGNNWCKITTKADVKKGKSYCLEFEAKALNANSVTVCFNSGTRTSLTPISNTYDWSTFKCNYVPTQNQTITIDFILDNKTDALWLDNIKLYASDETQTNLIQNGDFEDMQGPKESVDDEAVITDETETDESDHRLYARQHTISVDGSVDDWKDIDPMEIKTRRDLDKNIPAGDISADIKLAYDDENLYVAVIVQDKVHFPILNEKDYWKGDSVQLGLAEYGVKSPVLRQRCYSYDPETGDIFKTHEDFSVAASRNGNETIYEAAMPWKSYFTGDRPNAILFNAVVNNNDGDGRAYNLEISPGIVDSKNALLFDTLVTEEVVGDVGYYAMWPDKLEASVQNSAQMRFVNNSSNEQKVEVSCKDINYENTFSLSPKAANTIDFNFKINDVSDVVFNIDIKNGDKTVTDKRTTHFYLDYKKNYDAFKARLEKYVADLKALLLKCEEKGINPQYEIASYSVIAKCDELAEFFKSKNYYDSFEEFERVCKREYEKTKSALESYIKGESKPLSVPKYIGDSGYRFEGKTVYANTDNNGTIEERPYYFTGIGNWPGAGYDIPFFQNIGFNIIQSTIFGYRPFFMQYKVNGWLQQKVHGTLEDNRITLECSDEEAASGERSLKITNPDKFTRYDYVFIHQKVTVKPNTTYKYGYKAKGKGLGAQTPWCSVHGISGTRQKMHESDDWVEYDFEYTTKDNETTLDYQLLFEDIIEAAYIDDCYLMEKGSDTNLLSNAGFENVDTMKAEERLLNEYGWYANTEFFNGLRDSLKRAVDNNVTVDIAMNFDFLFDLICTEYPDLLVKQGNTGLKYQDEQVRDFIEIWIEAMMEVVSDYKCVQSIMLVNEPNFQPNLYDYYIPFWQDYLKNLYGSIDKLNENYGTDYKDFEEVAMPAKIESTPLFYDYRCFTDDLSNTVQKHMADEVKKIRPDLKVHSKIMGYLNRMGHNNFIIGQDLEEMSKYMDINGCDAYSGYNKEFLQEPSKMAWYDFMTSVKDAPVWDTETHILQDGNTALYDDLAEYFTGSDVWMGNIHGRGGTVIWFWDLEDARGQAWNNNCTYIQPNGMYRPADMIEASRAALDSNRLSYEVEAISKEKAKVGLYYSRTAQGYNDNDQDCILSAYEDAIYSGQKVEFVTDTQINKVHNYDLIVIPKNTNVPKASVDEIKEYIKNGGKVLMLDENALKYDEYNKPHNSEDVQYIYDNSDKTSTVKDKIKEMDLSEVKLINADTGEELNHVEWSYAVYNDKMLVNVVNYDKKNPVNVKVLYKGKEVTDMKELRSDEKINTGFELKCYQPIMLEFAK